MTHPPSSLPPRSLSPLTKFESDCVCNSPLRLNKAALLSEMSFIHCRCAMAVCALVAAIEHEWFEVYLFMPFRLSFPLHFGAKKWQASAAEAAEIRLALIALLVWLDCFVSGNI